MFGISIRLIWLIVALCFGVAEAFTLSLTMVWFSIGAIVAIGVSFLTKSIFIQIIVFAVVSFSLLYFATKKLIKMDRNNSKFWKSVDTNYTAVIGKKGFVHKKITPEEMGIVKVNGEEWSAISSDGKPIEKDEEVVVEDVQGVKLVVRKSM